MEIFVRLIESSCAGGPMVCHGANTVLEMSDCVLDYSSTLCILLFLSFPVLSHPSKSGW